MLGDHVRVGLEDNLRVSREKRADSNAELVEKAVALGALIHFLRFLRFLRNDLGVKTSDGSR